MVLGKSRVLDDTRKLVHSYWSGKNTSVGTSASAYGTQERVQYARKERMCTGAFFIPSLLSNKVDTIA